KGTCSVENSSQIGSVNITCGIGAEQGQAMLKILNKILADQLDPAAVMEKLDEILHAVNPNRQVKTYFCNGQWRTMGPGATAGLEVNMGGDASIFQRIIDLNNS